VTTFRESTEFLRGRTGERIVATWLQHRGWFVIPSYDYSGEDGEKAPKMHGQREAFVLPDLDVCKAGTRRWAEVKTKAAPTFTRITGRFEHGIPLRHYNEYQRVQRETGCHVYLFIVEEDTQIVIAESLDQLSKSVRRVDPRDPRPGLTNSGWRMARTGMAFFPRESFRFAQISVNDIVAEAAARHAATGTHA
jgi:hypothetical protein